VSEHICWVLAVVGIRAAAGHMPAPFVMARPVGGIARGVRTMPSRSSRRRRSTDGERRGANPPPEPNVAMEPIFRVESRRRVGVSSRSMSWLTALPSVWIFQIWRTIKVVTALLFVRRNMAAAEPYALRIAAQPSIYVDHFSSYSLVKIGFLGHLERPPDSRRRGTARHSIRQTVAGPLHQIQI
jgi:hypothetical protein